MDDLKKQMEVISRGTVELLPEGEFEKLVEASIKENRPLRVKQGFDPTAPDIHLGHTVTLRKLRQFQELGHQIVLIIGDYTGMVGDPSGKNSTRPRLSHDEVMENAHTYEKQFFKILDREKTEVHYNGDWFKEMNFSEIMELASKFTVARMLERDDFSGRFRGEQPISIHEFFYPLMQGYDSVAVKADIEIGGTDQKFNLLIARKIQEEYGVKPQCVLTMPILAGIDGAQRMSKSAGNYIGIDESPREMYGKTMSITDELIYTYFELVSDVDTGELSEIKKALSTGGVNPMEYKKKLAAHLVALYHGEEAAVAAEEEFKRIFSKGQLPDEIPEKTISESVPLVDLMLETGITASKGEARRLIQQGGVRLDDEKVTDINAVVSPVGEVILRAGKRRFLKIIGNS